MTEIQSLALKVEALRGAGYLDFKEKGESVLVQANRVMMGLDERLTRLEKMLEDVEIVE
jgi:hypothetical protein